MHSRMRAHADVPLPQPAWRELARAGKHHEAFDSLGAAEVEDLDGLLLAADAARLSGHTRAAVDHLTRLVERYPHDARAQLAAFTLGRLALYELSQPRLAARHFARAHALAPAGELAADALAREAEAHYRAGDRAEARSAAERYLARYPSGPRRKQLSSYLRER
jgi:transmembrane sensor